MPEKQLRADWEKWCTNYKENELGVNNKLWNSFDDTQVGWPHFERTTNIKAYHIFGAGLTVPPEKPADALPDMLDNTLKGEYFKGCVYVKTMNQIYTPDGDFMNQSTFNGAYGGKLFLTRNHGSKETDKPWDACLFSTDWMIPKVHHTRFLPDVESMAVLEDEFGRKGLNIYRPANIKMFQGDVGYWLDFLNRIFATPEDIKIFNEYIAHCIRYPGYKIPWAILFQSAEGVGKQMINKVIKHCIGESYTYEPEAEELISGASRFNAWMLGKLMIIVDEVRVGDRRDLLEGLKKPITDSRLKVEAKGVDQRMEDNVANWLFFSNFKDAIPITENNRRYAVFYSPLQTKKAILDAGLTKDFFDRMYEWLENGGYEALAYWYHNYPIEKRSLPHRAPKTSSYSEVIKIGRSPLEILVDNKIEAREYGFRSGYVSWPMLLKAIEGSKMRSAPAEHILKGVLENRGYTEIGHYHTIIGVEDMSRPPLLFAREGLTVEGYEHAQM